MLSLGMDHFRVGHSICCMYKNSGLEVALVGELQGFPCCVADFIGNCVSWNWVQARLGYAIAPTGMHESQNGSEPDGLGCSTC